MHQGEFKNRSRARALFFFLIGLKVCILRTSKLDLVFGVEAEGSAQLPVCRKTRSAGESRRRNCPDAKKLVRPPSSYSACAALSAAPLLAGLVAVSQRPPLARQQPLTTSNRPLHSPPRSTAVARRLPRPPDLVPVRSPGAIRTPHSPAAMVRRFLAAPAFPPPVRVPARRCTPLPARRPCRPRSSRSSRSSSSQFLLLTRSKQSAPVSSSQLRQSAATVSSGPHGLAEQRLGIASVDRGMTGE